MAWEPIPSNDLFIATLIPRTTSIRLGTGVSIIPHHHPVNVAVRLAFLDHLSRGRINAGFGQSGVPTDWGLFDLPRSRNPGPDDDGGDGAGDEAVAGGRTVRLSRQVLARARRATPTWSWEWG